MRVKNSIEIKASPERIWPFLVEPEKILQWCITFKKFDYTGEHHTGVGIPFYIEEEAGGRLMKLNFLATEWVQNEKFAFRMSSGDFLKSYDQKWAMQAEPDGSRFTFMEQVGLPYGIIGKVMGFFASRGSEATVKVMLEKLKSLAEANG